MASNCWNKHKTNPIFLLLPSFEIKADIRISNEHGSLDGAYVLLWNGPREWREELRLPGYSETQIGGKGAVSIKRSLAAMPLRIHQLHLTLGFGSELPHTDSFAHFLPAADDVIKNVHDRKDEWAQGDMR
jgi:hypothetical protein